MSKKCCKITYSDSETHCKVCGKYLGRSAADIFAGEGEQEDIDLFDYSNDNTGDLDNTDVLDDNTQAYSYNNEENEETEKSQVELEDETASPKNLADYDLDKSESYESGPYEDESYEGEPYEEELEEGESYENVSDEEESEEVESYENVSDEEESEEDESYEDESDEGELEEDESEEMDIMASGVKKFLGITTIIIALALTAFIGFGIYWAYFVSGHLQYKEKKVIEYPPFASCSDAQLETRQGAMPIVATYTDADALFREGATKTDATKTDATESENTDNE